MKIQYLNVNDLGIVPVKHNKYVYLETSLGTSKTFATKAENDAEIERLYNLIHSRVVKFGKL